MSDAMHAIGMRLRLSKVATAKRFRFGKLELILRLLQQRTSILILVKAYASYLGKLMSGVVFGIVKGKICAR